MTVIFSTDDGWILSHLQYLNNIYNVVTSNKHKCSLKFDENIFEINSQYLRTNQCGHDFENEIFNRKRKRKHTKKLPLQNLAETHLVKNKFNQIIPQAKAAGFFSCNIHSDNNKIALEASQKVYSDTFDIKIENLYGSNNNDTAILTEVNSEKYVFPKKCRFYCYDISEMTDKINLRRQYDFILLDPPWWNKSVRRKKIKQTKASYKMIYNEDLIQIPIKELLSKKGLIAVWCTNAPSHLDSILNELFPAWGIIYRATWYWVKITQIGTTICNFNDFPGKQPYELLILGASKLCDTYIPTDKLLISVPSAIHSHKPPIIEVLKNYLPENPQSLEIFARYLLPDSTSWGLEVLKFQHLSLYTITNNEIEDINIEEHNYE
ncbi:N(6)-adenine-specific methyltransferase METTL4 [Prorops nasuta]|uniref:N(6)-adenine-specific methyltransferase METTL4 n=1 Tax=Prorops nasuta TaxID=863751 RepID=UPI0034CF4E60